MEHPTGINVYANHLLPSLETLSPIVITPQEIIGYKYHLISSAYSLEKGLLGHGRRLIWTQWQLPKIYQKLKGGLIFSPLPEVPIFSDCRSILTIHDLTQLRFPKKISPFFRFYLPKVLKQAEHIICNSQATADDIINFWQIPASKITPILLAYDQQHFFPSPTPQKNNYFLYLGRHDPHKNVSRVIKAFAKFPDVNYQLWLAGSVDKRYTPKLQQLVTQFGLLDRVHFLNYLPYSQLPDLIRGATALVFPSLWEGFGLPVLEAMACGTPVITSNCSSLPEVAGDAAILVDPTNVDQIADSMSAIATNSYLRSSLIEKGLNRASQFSWEKTGQATVDVIKQFL